MSSMGLTSSIVFLQRLQLEYVNMDMPDSITKKVVKVNDLTNIPTLLLQRRLYWFGHDKRRTENELIN